MENIVNKFLKNDVSEGNILNLMKQPIPDSHILIDIDGKIIEANSNFIEFLDFERNEIIGKNFLSLVPIDLQKMFQMRLAALRSEGITECDVPILDSKEKEVPIWLKAIAIYNNKGHYTHAIITIRDLSERKMAETKLLEKIQRKEKHIASIDNDYCKLYELFQINLNKLSEIRKDFNYRNSFLTKRNKITSSLTQGQVSPKKLSNIVASLSTNFNAELSFMYIYND